MTSNLVKCACSSCGQTVEFDADIAGELIPCPNCGQTILLFIPQEQKTKHEMAANEFPRFPERINPSAKLHNTADIFGNLGSIFFFIAVFSAIITIAVHFKQENTFVQSRDLPGALEGEYSESEMFNSFIIGSIISSGLLALSFWLYLISQIIHIRANTTKDP